MLISPLSFWKRTGIVLGPIVVGDDIVTSGTVQGDILLADSSIWDGTFTLTVGAEPWVLDCGFNVEGILQCENLDALNGYITTNGTITGGTLTDGTLSITGGDLSTTGVIITTGVGGTGKFLTGLLGNTVFAFSGGNLDIRAGNGGTSAQNVLRVDNSGNFDFYDGNLTTTGTVQGGTLTDGTLSINSGSIASAVNIALTGTLSDGNYTFDTSGNVSGLGTVGCGTITLTVNSNVILSGTGYVEAAEFRGASGGSDIILLDGNGHRAFRSIRTTNSWVDNKNTQWFQAADNAESVIFAGYSGGKIPRLLFRATKVQISDASATTMPAPTSKFEVLGVAAIRALAVDADGDVGVGKDLTVGGLYNIAVTTQSGGTITAGAIIQDSSQLLHTYVPSNQVPTYRNIFIGYGSGANVANMTNAISPFHATDNIGVGQETLDALTTGYYNFAVGGNALGAVTTGHSNIGIGHFSGGDMDTGIFNIFLGRDAGRFITSGDHNTGIGWKALYGNLNVELNACIAIGYLAGKYEDTDNRLIIDNRDRINTARSREEAILYGVMAAAQADQLLNINAGCEVGDDVGSNQTIFAANGLQTMTGTARVERHITIGAASFTKGATEPTDGITLLVPWFGFADGRDDKAHYLLLVPHRWDTDTDVVVEIRWFNDDAAHNDAAKKVLWKCTYLSVSCGDTVDAVGTTISKLSAGSHVDNLIQCTTLDTGLIAANLTTDDDLFLMIWRDGNDPSDTFTNRAKLVSVHLHFIMDKLGQSIA